MATSKEKEPIEEQPFVDITLKGDELQKYIKDPCGYTATNIEEKLKADCQRKVNTLQHCCNCNLDASLQHLPKIHAHGDAPVFNTGTNGSGGAFPIGTNDSNWETYVDATRSLNLAVATAWTPAVVCQTNIGWTPAGPGHAWISSELDARPSNLYVDVFYRFRFVLCQDIDPATFVLNANLLTDNTLMKVWVNGVDQGTVPPTDHKGAPVPIKFPKNWKSCLNEIVFAVRNTGGPTAFVSQFTIDPFSVIQHDCTKCECKPVELPKVEPCFRVSWGNKKSDCIPAGCEVLCITACNCYSNVTFEQLTIGQISITDANGKPIPALADGTPAIEVVPYGPICFGDLGPCVQGKPSCKCRQVVLRIRGVVPGTYKLHLGTICYKVCFSKYQKECFEFNVCKQGSPS